MLMLSTPYHGDYQRCFQLIVRVPNPEHDTTSLSTSLHDDFKNMTVLIEAKFSSCQSFPPT